MKFDLYKYTNQGGRSYNEDSVASRTEGDEGIFVVADGLGGHAHGELASKCVCDTLTEAWHPGIEDPAAWLSENIAEANRRVLELQKEKNCVMKSTAVVLLIAGNSARWAHVGDSRLYYIHDDSISFITEDHSVAYKKYKAGEIRRSEIAKDEDQSRLLKTLGSEERYEAQLGPEGIELTPGDAFLLCSDGTWEFVHDEEVDIDYLKARNAKEWSEWMRLRIIDRMPGDNDNLTLLTLICS
ncbi:MAG: serine/threonine-protein phosphatase [Lachnospiraceae bacterium]|nr:serine/threonine-protein phosphatase [Lachnospiraceae bacterium]